MALYINKEARWRFWCMYRAVMRPAHAIISIWLTFHAALLCHRSAAALAPHAQQSFAVAFTSPSDFDRVSNGDPLVLSWSCSPLVVGSHVSPSGGAQQPTLVLSIHNENIQTQVQFVLAPFLCLVNCPVGCFLAPRFQRHCFCEYCRRPPLQYHRPCSRCQGRSVRQQFCDSVFRGL
jgi:hypothetical protein